LDLIFSVSNSSAVFGMVVSDSVRGGRGG